MFIPFFPSSPRYFLTPLRYYGLTPPSIPRVPKITFSHHPPPVFPYFSLALRRVSSTRLYLFSSLASSLPRSFESSTSYAWKGQEGRKEETRAIRSTGSKRNDCRGRLQTRMERETTRGGERGSSRFVWVYSWVAVE